MRLIKQIKEDPQLRDSFNGLAMKTFGLSFAEWWRRGYWTDSYIPYVFVDGERVVANASVNIMDLMWQGQPKRYIQIGTVMTDETYRHKGLSRTLLQEIIGDWAGKSDAIYLFANDTVLDFYPKFGFRREWEFQCSSPAPSSQGMARKLDMEAEADRRILLRHFQMSNAYSQFAMRHNVGLLMFYCGGFLKENVYWIPEYDAVLVAERENDALLCYDIFGGGEAPMTELLGSVAAPEITKILWGFTPKDTAGCAMAPLEEDDNALFVYAGKENLFAEHKLMFPLLSHA